MVRVFGFYFSGIVGRFYFGMAFGIYGVAPGNSAPWQRYQMATGALGYIGGQVSEGAVITALQYS